MIRLEPTRLSADSIFLQLRGFFLGKKSKKTKWLGAHQCIARLFDQWSALEQFFVIASAEDRQVAPDKILLEMRHPFTKAYLRFFKYAFNDFNYFNALFQSAKIVIGDMQSECEKFIKTLCSKFIKERFLGDSTKINPSNPSHFRSLEDVFLGNECAQYLLTSVQSGKITPEDVSTFQKKVFRFLHYRSDTDA